VCVCGELGISADGTSHRDRAGVSMVAAIPASQLQGEPQPQWHVATVPQDGRNLQRPRSLVRAAVSRNSTAAVFYRNFSVSNVMSKSSVSDVCYEKDVDFSGLSSVSLACYEDVNDKLRGSYEETAPVDFCLYYCKAVRTC